MKPAGRDGLPARIGRPSAPWACLGAVMLLMGLSSVAANDSMRGQIRGLLIDPAMHATSAHATWTLRFRWPDGTSDCEAMSVDPATREILLTSKRRVPP
jgi:hypothetical protein